MRRRQFISLMAGAAASSVSSALAQKWLFRIGWLAFGHDAQSQIDRSLKDALAQNGLLERKNIEIVYRFAKGSSTQLSPLASELADSKPDILVGIGGDVVTALFEASKGRIPIVGGVSDNPIRAGLATSLARPGKNFTGVTFLTDEMAAKRVELLKEAIPNAKRVAVIHNPQHLDDELVFAQRAAGSLAIQLLVHPIIHAEELDAALRVSVTNRADAVFVIASRLTNLLSAKLAQFGLNEKVPVIAAWREFAANGALLSYGPDRVLQAKTIAEYVQKVLNGAKPADLPIEQPTKFELVVNLKTARTIGLTINREVLARADDLID
jgi:putative tryptophan/tyrosine transport system substrate-binding protein